MDCRFSLSLSHAVGSWSPHISITGGRPGWFSPFSQSLFMLQSHRGGKKQTWPENVFIEWGIFRTYRCSGTERSWTGCKFRFGSYGFCCLTVQDNSGLISKGGSSPSWRIQRRHFMSRLFMTIYVSIYRMSHYITNMLFTMNLHCLENISVSITLIV